MEFSGATVTVTEMLDLIEHVYLPCGKAAIFVGAPGIAKTDSTLALVRRKQAADPMFGGCYFNMGGSAGFDLFGAPQVTRGALTTYGVPLVFQPNERFGMRGAYPVLNDPDVDATVPDFNIRALKPYDRGICIVDEPTKAQSENDFAKLAELMKEGTTGQWGLGSGWAKIAFANAEEHGSNDMTIPMHTKNRVGMYRVEMVFEDISTYWRSIHMHPDFLAFAEQNAGIVFSRHVPITGDQFCTGRSYTEAWQLVMGYCQHLGIDNVNADQPGLPYSPSFLPGFVGASDDEDINAMVRGMLAILAAHCGDQIAREFLDFVNHSHEKPTLAEVVASPNSAVVTEHPGVLSATVEMLVSQSRFEDREKIFSYVYRLPRAMGAVFCTKYSARFGFRVSTDKSFRALVDRCGAGARIALAPKPR